jgi:phosphopantothenoylcysteine decarboxylase/phosphopantothenate--cysteine ligase
MLAGKKIILGVTGSISAYKSAWLVRELVKEGAEVQVIFTHAAHQFVTALTFSTLCKKPVFTDFVKNDLGEWVNHVQLALWADLMLIAPCSSSTLSKLANGKSDNLLVTTYLSLRSRAIICPAMDHDMYLHETTQNNIKTIQQSGNIIIYPESGELASGLIGEGRLPEVSKIVENVKQYFSKSNRYHSKKILVTAGPTYEKIDPVRFIGNYSSGKMGYAIANAFLQQGAEVILISGPVNLTLSHPNLKLIRVESAIEMQMACETNFDTCDFAIFSAAVADYRPAQISNQKIKKESSENEQLNIQLIKNPDILFDAGKKKQHQIVIGFALETENEIENAKKKLKRKNADYIILNSLQTQGAGFQVDTNEVKIIDNEGSVYLLSLKSKQEIASEITDYLYERHF